MAYVRVDKSRMWIGDESSGPICPQLVQIVSTDSPYVTFDFEDLLTEDSTISSADTPVEVNSATITIADSSVSNDGKRVSFKVSGMAAGNFLMSCTVTLTDGTTNKISLQGRLRVI
jgi:hypothetical protein